MLLESHGFDVKYIDDTCNRSSFDLKADIISKNGGAEIDPYKYTHQLLNVSCSISAEVYENTEVMNLVHYDDHINIITEFGYKVRTKKVIVATGYNTTLFTERNFVCSTWKRHVTDNAGKIKIKMICFL